VSAKNAAVKESPIAATIFALGRFESHQPEFSASKEARRKITSFEKPI